VAILVDFQWSFVGFPVKPLNQLFTFQGLPLDPVPDYVPDPVEGIDAPYPRDAPPACLRPWDEREGWGDLLIPWVPGEHWGILRQ